MYIYKSNASFKLVGSLKAGFELSSASIHVDFDELLNEISKLQNVDNTLQDELTFFVGALKKITVNVESVLRQDSNEDEKKLWQDYTQLQQSKLLVLDLSHEYNHLEVKVRNFNPNLNVLLKNSIEELSEHIEVGVETHRANIDILEIRYARKLSVNALVVTAIIAYIAVWEYTVREFIATMDFPYGLSPLLNDVLVVVTLIPVIAMVVWAILNRRTRL
jgi:hypothetical protein